MRARIRIEDIDLSELGDLVDSQDYQAGYLDPSTGEVIRAFDGEVYGEDGEPLDLDEVDWVAVGGGTSSRAAYLDMEEFAEAVGDPEVASRLRSALDGRGAFRRFKDAMSDAPEEIRAAWNRFRDLRSQIRATEWLVDKDLVDEANARLAMRRLEAACDDERRRVKAPGAVPSTGARLILLNGMPGIGKSTLAARYVADRPGVLHLDADRLRTMIGGDLAETAGPARKLALAMASAHLRAGYDVVLPQLVAQIDQLERFEQVAREAGATLVHIVLADDAGTPAERFLRRSGDDPWHADVIHLVEREGGPDRLAIYEQGLRQVVSARPATRVLPSREGEVDRSYADLVALLDPT